MSTQDARPLWSLYGLALGVLVFMSGCRAAPGDSPREDRQVTRAITRLLARPDADTVATAAILRVSSDRDAALSLAVQALEADPNRPDLLWLAISICRNTPKCSPGAWDQRLAAVDPKNAAPHLDGLRLATEAGDERTTQVALNRIARSETLNLYRTRLMARSSRAVVQTDAMPLRAAQSAILAGLGLLIPPFNLSRHCTDETLADPSGRERCQGIATVLQRGDTVTGEMEGVALALRAWPTDSAEWHAADTARRVHDYRVTALGKDPLWMNHHADQFLALSEANPREQDLMRQQLVLIGLPPDPPQP